jgi:tRNA threonylcarbamoyladenosine biosynthesis protein TsaB
MLLALDTSTAQAGLALYDGTFVLGEFSWRSIQRLTVEIAPAIQELLTRTGYKIGDIQALGVALGPGSFTSLRVGISLAKGLALARRIPLIGIPSLDIVAAGLTVQNLPLATVLHAGRGRLAVAWYHSSPQGWQIAGPIEVLTADELADKVTSPTLVCGELDADERQRLLRKYRNILLCSPGLCLRRPGLLAELAWQRWQKGEQDASVSLAPIYLHSVGIPLS